MKISGNTIKFNSGRSYTEHGQRIAAMQVTPEVVYMVDADRGVCYALRCELDQYIIMHCYDRADEYRVYWHDLKGFTYDDEYKIRNELTKLALTAPSRR